MSDMTIGATCEYHTSVNKIIVRESAVALHIEQQAARYQERLAVLQSIVNRRRKLASTAQLKELDYNRDLGLGLAGTVIRAYRTSLVPLKREAALRLIIVIDDYKGIHTHEYRKQTAEMRGMLAELAKPEHAADLAILGLTEDVAALAEVHQAFEDALMGKMAELEDHVVQGDIESEDLVEEINGIYEEIVQVVNAYAIIQPSEANSAFIKSVNGIVEGYSDFGEGNTSGGTAPDAGGTSDGSSSDDGSDGSDGGTTGGGSSDGDSSDSGDSGSGGSTGGDDDDGGYTGGGLVG